MRILFHVCKDISETEYDALSDIQKDIVGTWAKIRGNLFSITQVADRNICSRGKVQKAVRQLEKRGVVRRYCGGYKTRWDAILCDECKREFERSDIRYHVCSTFAWLGRWGQAPFSSRLTRFRDRNWHYEARICHDCITKVMRSNWLMDFGVAVEFLGFNRKEE